MFGACQIVVILSQNMALAAGGDDAPRREARNILAESVRRIDS